MYQSIKLPLLLLWVHLSHQAPVGSSSDPPPKPSLASPNEAELSKICEALQQPQIQDDYMQMISYRSGSFLFTATQRKSQSKPDDDCQSMLGTVLGSCRDPADQQQIKSDCTAHEESEGWKYEIKIAPGDEDQANPSGTSEMSTMAEGSTTATGTQETSATLTKGRAPGPSAPESSPPNPSTGPDGTPVAAHPAASASGDADHVQPALGSSVAHRLLGQPDDLADSSPGPVDVSVIREVVKEALPVIRKIVKEEISKHDDKTAKSMATPTENAVPSPPTTESSSSSSAEAPETAVPSPSTTELSSSSSVEPTEAAVPPSTTPPSPPPSPTPSSDVPGSEDGKGKPEHGKPEHGKPEHGKPENEGTDNQTDDETPPPPPA